MKPRSLALIAIAAMVACRRAPVAPPPPATPPPAGVIAVVTLPSIEVHLPRVVAYVESVSPSDGTNLRAELEKELHPDAADGKRPMHFVFLAPAVVGEDPEAVIVAAVRDEAALAKTAEEDIVIRTANGWAVVGSAPTVDRVLAWATTTLVSAPVPSRATAVVYAEPIRAVWGADIEMELGTDPYPPTSAARDATAYLWTRLPPRQIAAVIAQMNKEQATVENED